MAGPGLPPSWSVMDLMIEARLLDGENASSWGPQVSGRIRQDAVIGPGDPRHVSTDGRWKATRVELRILRHLVSPNYQVRWIWMNAPTADLPAQFAKPAAMGFGFADDLEILGGELVDSHQVVTFHVPGPGVYVFGVELRSGGERLGLNCRWCVVSVEGVFELRGHLRRDAADGVGSGVLGPQELVQRMTGFVGEMDFLVPKTRYSMRAHLKLTLDGQRGEGADPPVGLELRIGKTLDCANQHPGADGWPPAYEWVSMLPFPGAWEVRVGAHSKECRLSTPVEVQDVKYTLELSFLTTRS